MEVTTALVILVFAILFISIGFMIPETKYKVAYYMILALLTFSILNIYLSVVYYIQLRNDPGIPGLKVVKVQKVLEVRLVNVVFQILVEYKMLETRF
jgi:hypothetical protein